jgi:hypothetical protein
MASQQLLSSLEYFFKNNCQCIKRECTVNLASGVRSSLKLLDSLEQSKNTLQSNCNIVSVRHTTVNSTSLDSDTDSVLKNYIQLYETFKIEKILSQFFILLNTYPKTLFNRKSFTWNNIQSISPPEVDSLYNSSSSDLLSLYRLFTQQDVVDFYVLTDIIKLLFWYYRKSFVDNLIKDIISTFHLDIVVYSVGSTNVTSDYDLTLYGNYNHIAYCIKIFHNTFFWYFNDTSSNVFDTNLYGGAFISFDLNHLNFPLAPSPSKTSAITTVESHDVPPILTSQTCNDLDFYILNDPTHKIVAYQHVWLFIKLFNHFGTQSPLTRLFQSSSSTATFVSAAKNIWPSLSQIKNRISYSTIVNKLETVKNDLVNFSNIVSLVNFMGHETYYTRGSFLSVVVNSQLCHQNAIVLDDHTIVDSVCENLFDFLFYHKIKYLDRAAASASQLQSSTILPVFQQIRDMFQLCQYNCDFTLVQPLVVDIVRQCFSIVGGSGSGGKLDFSAFSILHQFKHYMVSRDESSMSPISKSPTRLRTSTFSSGTLPSLSPLKSIQSLQSVQSPLSVKSHSPQSNVVKSFQSLPSLLDYEKHVAYSDSDAESDPFSDLSSIVESD